MSSTLNRELLLKVAGLVRPALATAAYIPSLTHISFDGEYATAYNDLAAIAVRLESEIKRCLPGEFLIRALNSFGGESIAFQEGKDGALVLKSGRSTLKVPTLELKAFPYKPPEDMAEQPDVLVDGSILKGIERCLLSVNNDPTHPAQMGVTLDVDKAGMATLFSTDNFSISRYQTQTAVKLPGDSPVILPRFFCEQLVALAKAFPDEKVRLWILDGALFAEFGRAAELFSKTLVDTEPLNFPTMFGKHVKVDKLKAKLAPIPDSWEAAFTRALLVLAAEEDKATRMTIMDSSIDLVSSSPAGDADDRLQYEAADDDPDEPFHVDPTLVMRASKVCDSVGFTDKVLILADKDARFVHIVAHSAK